MEISKPIKITVVVGLILCIIVGFLPFVASASAIADAFGLDDFADWYVEMLLDYKHLDPEVEFYNLMYDYAYTDYYGYSSLFDIPVFSSPGIWNDEYLNLFVDMNWSQFKNYNDFKFIAYCKERIEAEYSSSMTPSFTGDFIKQNNIPPLEVDGDTFNDILSRYANQYGPKDIKFDDRTSWQTRTYKTTKSYDKNNFNIMDLYVAGQGLPNGKGECWLQPFTYINDTYAYMPLEIHVYMQTENGKNYLYYDFFQLSLVDDTVTKIGTRCFKYSLGDYPFVRIGFTAVNRFYVEIYNSLNNYISYTASTYTTYSDIMTFPNYRSSDLSVNITPMSTSVFSVTGNFKPDSSGSAPGTDNDFGFLVSDEFIVNCFSIIPNFKPDDYVVLSGDTFYDYSVHDNSHRTTVYNYITNNYTYTDDDVVDIPDYPDIPDIGETVEPSNPSSGGVGDIKVSGNVNVSGNVEIGIKPIDINVNLNNSGSSSSDNTDIPELPDIDEFVEYLPEPPQSIMDYFAKFFSTLPGEITALVLGGIAAAIIARILGR